MCVRGERERNRKGERARERGERERRASLTDSAISGPIPSPGKRVAVMRSEEEEEEKDREKAADENIPLARFPRTRLTIPDAIVG